MTATKPTIMTFRRKLFLRVRTRQTPNYKYRIILVWINFQASIIIKISKIRMLFIFAFVWITLENVWAPAPLLPNPANLKSAWFPFGWGTQLFRCWHLVADLHRGSQYTLRYCNTPWSLVSRNSWRRGTSCSRTSIREIPSHRIPPR